MEVQTTIISFVTLSSLEIVMPSAFLTKRSKGPRTLVSGRTRSSSARCSHAMCKEIE